MITASVPAISSESQANARVAAAARAARVGGRLLLFALLLLPVYGSLVADGAWAARLAIAGLFCITVVRPADGLLLCAAFLPLGAVVATLLGFPSSLREPFVLAFLSAWLLRDTIRRPPAVDPATRDLLLPPFLFAATVAASIVVQLIVQQPFEDFPGRFFVQVLARLAGTYVTGDAYPGLAPGAAIVEGVGLYAGAVLLCRRHALLDRQLLAMVAVAGAGVAGLNVYRFAEICLRHPGLFGTLVFNPRIARISVAFFDFNAAGSYLAMMLLVTASLAVAAGRRVRWGWVVSAMPILAALWFTGSRAAWASTLLSGVAAVAWTRSRIRRLGAAPLSTVIGVALIVIALLVFVVGVPVFSDQLSTAFGSRLGLGSAALRMTGSHPIFGVGVGRFRPESAAYLDPAFARNYYASENAHNNFLQILAEIGIVGFLPFLWLLVAVGRRTWTALTTRGDAILSGAACALLAFLLSCLAGHPLLISEVALAFWLVLGVTAARASGRKRTAADDATARAGGQTRRRAWLMTAALVCLAVSVPIRVRSFIANQADLGPAVIGFSRWSTDDRGMRYRTMTGRGQFFVPASTCEIRLSMRVDRTEKRRAADVELRVDDVVANRVHAVADSWRDLKVLLRIDSGRRFRRIELRTLPDADVRLLTGRPALAECTRNPF